jgi:hypothetical protein
MLIDELMMFASQSTYDPYNLREALPMALCFQVDNVAHYVYTDIALPNCKKRGSRADLRDEAHSFLLCDPLRMPTLVIVSTRHALSQFALACVLPGLGAFLLLCGSAFQATAHDGAHDAFMTLPPYTRISEDEARQLGSGPKPCWVGLCVRKCSHLRDYPRRWFRKSHHLVFM